MKIECKQSFIEKYVQLQGKIDEVLIETQTRADDTAIIHRLKDSWTREELKEACLNAWEAGANDEPFDQWFNKNY